MNTLILGSCDQGKTPIDRMKFLQMYHYLGVLSGTVSFRDDDRSKWRRFKELPGNDVLELQSILHSAGFSPRGRADGIYGYSSEASARLFQEYVRSIEGHKEVVPDGIIGKGTWNHLLRWKENNISSGWGKHSVNNPTDEYTKWIQVLKDTQKRNIENPNEIFKLVNDHPKISDTKKVKDWNIDPSEIHLIGIRRNADKSVSTRLNDDLFVLLINGMVFKFWGSTDPSSTMAGRADEAFLTEGQHLYRYGWHKITVESKVYRAMKPHKYGVLVFRDRNDDNALTEADINKGLDRLPNGTINIHWSGIGTTNFSAGCQVIAGKSYINHLNQVADCSTFAARNYSTLNDAGKKTKGAYNVFFDLIVAYAKPQSYHIHYTLVSETTINLKNVFGPDYVKSNLEKMGA